jgi:hypothetical protein
MGLKNFKSVLWLDDNRMPLILGIDWVKNYDQFVSYLENKGIPDLICFDHDLAIEHYPVFENRPGMQVPYDSYKEKTGLHAARYIIERRLPLRQWSVHSMNVQGRINIETELRRYCPQGELRGLQLPYRVISGN